MRKYLLLFVSAFCITHHAVDIPTLESKAFDSFFKSEHKHKLESALKERKVNFNVVFKDRTLNKLDFSNLPLINITFEKTTFNNVIFKNADLTGSRFEEVTFHDIDFLSMNLKGIHFIQCMFKNVNFSHADLRDIVLTGSKFKDVNLYDAVLYYPFEGSKEEVQKKGFKITNWDPNNLVKQYSSLISPRNIHRFFNLIKKPVELLKQAKCLNKFFPALALRLYHINLKDLNLTGIDLEDGSLQAVNLEGTNLTQANLKNILFFDARLQKVKLSANVTLPDYPKNDRTKLFKLWTEGNPEEQEMLQKLVNAGFNIIKGVDSKTLREGIEKKKNNLQNMYLNHTNLEGADLTNANLKKATLYYSILRKANLTKANLKKTNLDYAKLGETNLSKAILIKAHLYYTNLEKANLSEATLTKARLDNINLYDTNLSGLTISDNIKLPVNLTYDDLIDLLVIYAEMSCCINHGFYFEDSYCTKCGIDFKGCCTIDNDRKLKSTIYCILKSRNISIDYFFNLLNKKIDLNYSNKPLD